MKGNVMALGVGSSRLQALGIKAGGRHAKISVESSEAIKFAYLFLASENTQRYNEAGETLPKNKTISGSYHTNCPHQCSPVITILLELYRTLLVDHFHCFTTNKLGCLLVYKYNIV